MSDSAIAPRIKELKPTIDTVETSHCLNDSVVLALESSFESLDNYSSESKPEKKFESILEQLYRIEDFRGFSTVLALT